MPARSLVERSADFDVVIAAGDFASVHEGLEETIEALAGDRDADGARPRQQRDRGRAARGVRRAGRRPRVLHGESTEIDGVDVLRARGGRPDDAVGLELRPQRRRRPRSGSTAAREGAVLVVHSPPQGHCDRSSGGDHLGSHAILDAIARRQPPLAVCGHIHEAWGERSQIGPTEIANLGPAGAEFEV